MLNFFDAVLNDKRIKKFKVDDLVFAEYKCPEGDEKIKIWSHNNYFDFILEGKMIWKTPKKEYLIQAGDAYFVKKGGYISHHFYDEQFCDIVVFTPDEFIMSVVNKYKISFNSTELNDQSDTIIPLNLDETLAGYLQSLLPYFRSEHPSPESILKLKFEELLINILAGNNNLSVINYCKEICLSSRVSIKDVMEANFAAGLSLEEYACLCARSLSTFKRDFCSAFRTTPGKWLNEKKLDYSRFLIETTDKSIEEVSFESGFKSRTHFIKVFNQKFGRTPLQYKKQIRPSDLK